MQVFNEFCVITAKSWLSKLSRRVNLISLVGITNLGKLWKAMWYSSWLNLLMKRYAPDSKDFNCFAYRYQFWIFITFSFPVCLKLKTKTIPSDLGIKNFKQKTAKKWAYLGNHFVQIGINLWTIDQKIFQKQDAWIKKHAIDVQSVFPVHGFEIRLCDIEMISINVFTIYDIDDRSPLLMSLITCPKFVIYIVILWNAFLYNNLLIIRNFRQV